MQTGSNAGLRAVPQPFHCFAFLLLTLTDFPLQASLPSPIVLLALSTHKEPTMETSPSVSIFLPEYLEFPTVSLPSIDFATLSDLGNPDP